MRERIAETKGSVFWTDLEAHIKRDAVIIAHGELDLVDVGVAFAANDTNKVQGWISAGKLKKPSSEDISRWSVAPNLTFVSVVVQPFVLIHAPELPRPS